MRKGKAIQFTSNTIVAGILIMLVGDFLFSANDVMGKWLVATFSVGQILLIRSLGAFIILGPMLTRETASSFFRPKQPFLIFLRALFAAGDTGFFYAAALDLPLANIMTFYMAGPIYLAALSHFFLEEKIHWRRWLAIFIGFIGVLIALNPSIDTFLTKASILALLGSFCFALLIFLSRILRSTSDTVLVTWQTIGAGIAGIAFSIGQWTEPNPTQWTMLALLGIISCLGHLFIARATKLAPASILAPLQYTLLLWAIIFGFIFFNDIPELHTIIGASIIVLSGLFIFHRKRVVEHRIPEGDVPKDMH